MDQEQPLNDDLESFAAALGELKPRASDISHERLMFEVWRSQEALVYRRRLRAWRAATGVSTTAAVIFLTLFLGNRPPQINAVPREPLASQSSKHDFPIAKTSGRQNQTSEVLTTEVVQNRTERSNINLRDRMFLEQIDDFPSSEITANFQSIRASTYRDCWDSIMDPAEAGG